MSNNRFSIWPRRTVDYSKPEHFIRKEMPYIGFVCPHCFTPMIFRASITMNLQNVDKNSDAPLSITPQYNIQCTRCDVVTSFDYCLDPNITPVIATLNRKGYETLHSCEGHRVNQQDSSLPYIHFKYPKHKPIVKYIPLQGPWKLDTENEYEFIIKCDDLSVPIRERMAYLRRWANALPYCFEDEFKEWMFTKETREALAYKELNTPLREDEKSTKEELAAFDESGNIITNEEKQNKHYHNNKSNKKHNNHYDNKRNNSDHPQQDDGYKYYFNPKVMPRQKTFGLNNYGKSQTSSNDRYSNKKYGNNNESNKNNNKKKYDNHKGNKKYKQYNDKYKNKDWN